MVLKGSNNTVAEEKAAAGSKKLFIWNCIMLFKGPIPVLLKEASTAPSWDAHPIGSVLLAFKGK